MPNSAPFRPRMFRLVWAVSIVLLAALATPFVYAPGAGEDAEPDFEDGLHVTARVARVIDVPLDRFDTWFKTARLEDILPGSSLIPKVVGSDLIQGSWADVGARRRVHLDGGGTALEQVIANNPPEYFAYKVWDIGGPGERLIRYVRGEFVLTALPDNRTLVEWRYSLRPRTTAAFPLVTAFANFGITPFLRSGIEAIKSNSERAFNAGG